MAVVRLAGVTERLAIDPDGLVVERLLAVSGVAVNGRLDVVDVLDVDGRTIRFSADVELVFVFFSVRLDGLGVVRRAGPSRLSFVPSLFRSRRRIG